MPFHPNLAHPLVRDMFAWWLYDPDLAAGNVWYDVLRERNGNIANGVMTGDVSWSRTSPPGRKGSLYFGGVNGVVTCMPPLGMAYTTSFTISAWYNITIANETLLLFETNNLGVGGFGTYSVNAAYEFYNNGNVTVFTDRAPAANTVNTWINIIFVVNELSVSCYVNNILLGTKAMSAVITSYNNWLMGTDTFGDYFTGNIADISFHATPFTAQQCSQLYTESLNGYPNMLWRPKKRFFYGPSVSALIVQRRTPGPTRVGSRRAA